MSGPPISRIFPAVASAARHLARYSITSPTAMGWAMDFTHEGHTITLSRSTRYCSISYELPLAPIIREALSSVTGMPPEASTSPTSFLLLMWGDMWRPASCSPPR